MSDLVSSIQKEEAIQEASYKGNIGFEELVTYYQKASDSDIKEMEKYIKQDSWYGVKKMINKVLGVRLK